MKMQWQPIKTAPTDGTNILVWWSSEFHCPLVAHWNDGKWNDNKIGWKLTAWDNSKETEPTHWMPLPEIPVAKLEHHTDSEDCWCCPTIEEHEGGNLIIHNRPN